MSPTIDATVRYELTELVELNKAMVAAYDGVVGQGELKQLFALLDHPYERFEISGKAFEENSLEILRALNGKGDLGGLLEALIQSGRPKIVSAIEDLKARRVRDAAGGNQRTSGNGKKKAFATKGLTSGGVLLVASVAIYVWYVFYVDLEQPVEWGEPITQAYVLEEIPGATEANGPISKTVPPGPLPPGSHLQIGGEGEGRLLRFVMDGNNEVFSPMKDNEKKIVYWVPDKPPIAQSSDPIIEFIQPIELHSLNNLHSPTEQVVQGTLANGSSLTLGHIGTEPWYKLDLLDKSYFFSATENQMKVVLWNIEPKLFEPVQEIYVFRLDEVLEPTPRTDLSLKPGSLSSDSQLWVGRIGADEWLRVTLGADVMYFPKQENLKKLAVWSPLKGCLFAGQGGAQVYKEPNLREKDPFVFGPRARIRTSTIERAEIGEEAWYRYKRGPEEVVYLRSSDAEIRDEDVC